MRETVSRRRSQTSTVKHSRPIPNHLNGSRSSKIADAHLPMSLRDVVMRFPAAERASFGGRLRRRPWAYEKFRGYRGLAPYGLGLDERVLKMDWVNARGCAKIILYVRVRRFQRASHPLDSLDAVRGRIGDFG